MVLLWCGSNGDGLRISEQVEWRVGHSSCKHLSQCLVLVILTITLQKKRGTLTKNNWEIWRKNFANSIPCKGPALSVVLLSGRIITCEITGKSKSKRRSGSKVHCLYKTKVSKQITQNVELLINEYLERTEYPISKLL